MLEAFMNTIARRRLGWGIFFISPWIVGFLAFTVYPITASLYYSFTNYNIINFTPTWVGLDNYSNLMSNDNVFWGSLRVTLYYVVMLVVLATVFDILIAMLLNMNVRGLSIYRTVFYLPVMVPVVAATLTWVWILNPRHGLINACWRGLALTVHPGWLLQERHFSRLSLWLSGVVDVRYLSTLQA